MLSSGMVMRHDQSQVRGSKSSFGTARAEVVLCHCELLKRDPGSAGATYLTDTYSLKLKFIREGVVDRSCTSWVLMTLCPVFTSAKDKPYFENSQLYEPINSFFLKPFEDGFYTCTYTLVFIINNSHWPRLYYQNVGMLKVIYSKIFWNWMSRNIIYSGEVPCILDWNTHNFYSW